MSCIMADLLAITTNMDIFYGDTAVLVQWCLRQARDATRGTQYYLAFYSHKVSSVFWNDDKLLNSMCMVY